MSTFNSKGGKQNFTFGVKLLLPLKHKFEKTWLGIDFCWKFKIMSRMPTERFNPTIYRSTHWDSTHRLPTKPSQRLNTGIEDNTQKSLEEIVQNYSAMCEAAKGIHNRLIFLKKETNVQNWLFFFLSLRTKMVILLCCYLLTQELQGQDNKEKNGA